MSGAINSTHGIVEINRGHISGYEVAITLQNSDVVIKDTDFKDVKTVVRGTGNTSIDAKSVTHTEGKWGANPIPLEVLRRIANVNV